MTHPRKGRKSAATLSFVPKGRIAAHGAASFPCAAQGSVSKGAILFHKRECPPLDHPRERFRLAVWGLNYFDASGMQLPARGEAAFSIAIRFASAPTTRCRSAHLVEVHSNSRLPPVSTMRRAQQCRYFARSLPPSKRHSRLTAVRRGCEYLQIAEDSWRSHVHRAHTAQRVQFFKLQTANVRGRGVRPLAFLWGIQRGYSLRKENTPFGAATRTPLPLPRSRGKQCAALRAAIIRFLTNKE